MGICRGRVWNGRKPCTFKAISNGFCRVHGKQAELKPESTMLMRISISYDLENSYGFIVSANKRNCSIPCSSIDEAQAKLKAILEFI